MAQYELLLPKMGESVAEATIIKWVKQPGDLIAVDESVLEIATDKVDSEVPSPVAGKLVKQLFREDEVAEVGSVIAIIETDVNASPEDTAVKSAIEAPIFEPAMPEIPGIDQVSETKPASAADYKESTRF